MYSHVRQTVHGHRAFPATLLFLTILEQRRLLFAFLHFSLLCLLDNCHALFSISYNVFFLKKMYKMCIPLLNCTQIQNPFLLLLAHARFCMLVQLRYCAMNPKIINSSFKRQKRIVCHYIPSLPFLNLSIPLLLRPYLRHHAFRYFFRRPWWPSPWWPSPWLSRYTMET